MIGNLSLSEASLSQQPLTGAKEVPMRRTVKALKDQKLAPEVR